MLSEIEIFAALEAERNGELFSIDFDQIWRSYGYRAKEQALERFLATHVEGEDYIFSGKSEKIGKGRPRNVYKLSGEAVKSFGMVAETSQGRKVRKYYIEVEKQYRANLERALNSEPNPEVTELKGRIAELEAKLGAVETEIAYPYKLEDLKEVSGIVNRSQLKSTVKQNFEQGADWIELDSVLLLTLDTFNILVLSLRSKRGTDITRLPSIIKIKTEQYFKFLNRPKRKNTCIAQREKELEDHGQLRVPGV